VDATLGPFVGFKSEPWYPRAAVSSVTGSDDAPTGFTGHILHVRWASIPMLIPNGSLTDKEWWEVQTPTWGNWLQGEPSQVESTGNGWVVEFPKYRAYVLPMDEDGHGRRLSELNCDYLDTAIGGIQHDGRDVILVFKKREMDTMILDSKNLKLMGETLGQFHTICGQNLALPNDERLWNRRLDILEPRTRSATKWRAPHSPDTQGTITHRNFDLSNCRLEAGHVIITGCVGGVRNALLPENSPSPAIRDVAAAVQGLSPEERQTFCDAWSDKAPPHWSSSKALDGHRGGIQIWEYEKQLENRLFHQAWGQNEPIEITRFFAGISTLQNRMYQARTLAAAGLICFSLPPCAALYWIFYPGAIAPTVSDISAMTALFGIGWILRRLYRASAPKPW
tara:strand:- start:3362 stop:4543 length:1182 start_codon:yes stop_codon:yes gene_type:complete